MDGPVLGEALVRAACDGVSRNEQVHADIELRDVVAGRQSSLKQNGRLASVGDLHAIYLDFDMPGAVQDVDPRVRVVWVDENLLVLLKPSVHGVPLEADQVAQLLDRRLRVVPGGILDLAATTLDGEVVGV